MFSPKSWIILSKDLVDLWSKYEDQLTLLQTTKLSTGMSQGFEAWKKAQSVLLTEYKNQVDKLTGELQTHIKESVKDIITNAIKVADVETMASMHKDEKGYKTSKKVIATEINKVLDDQSKLVKATVKQFMINDGKIVSQIKTDIKRQVKYSASHTRELKERQLEHLNNAATYDVVKRYSLDTEFRSTKVQYPSGRQMSLRSHVEMNIRTHVQQVALNTMSKACSNLGYDLFLASEHADCADDHIKYQGKVFTTHPSKYDGKYPSKKDAEKEGFCTRPNCRHFWIPITEEQANNLDATKKSLFIKKGEYDPKNYEDLKKQRYNERAIRHYKNKRDNLLAMVQNATGAEKIALENDAEKYNAKVKEWQKRQRDLMKENDFLTRDYQRENAQKLAYDLGYRLEQKNSSFEYRGINKLTNQYLNKIYDNRNIVLTKERRDHINERHPEVKLSEEMLYDCINKPDYMCEDTQKDRILKKDTYNIIKQTEYNKYIFITLKMSKIKDKENSIISVRYMSDKNTQKYMKKNKNLLTQKKDDDTI